MKKNSSPQSDLIVLVMAGGASSRLYPFDKVLSDLTDCGRTMIQQALDRVAVKSRKHGKALISKKDFFVVTGAAYKPQMERQLKGVPRQNILAEPERRNTWPAILWAMTHIRKRHANAVLAILTADHLIGAWPVFRKQLEDAVKIARREKAIVTFGIRTEPDSKRWTGFGAIKAAKAAGGAARVLRFDEKPSEARAAEMIDEGGYFWNSGMFIGEIKTFEAALQYYQPSTFTQYAGLCEAVTNDGGGETAAECFRNFPSKIRHPGEPSKTVDHSIDYAVMVPLTQDVQNKVRAYVIAAKFSWLDIGSWDNLRQALKADKNKNIVAGRAKLRECKKCIFVSKPGIQIEARGLSGHIVIAAEKTAVVLPEARAQEMKNLYQEIQRGAKSQRILLESRDCEISAGSKSVAALGVSGLRIGWKGKKLFVEKIVSYGK